MAYFNEETGHWDYSISPRAARAYAAGKKPISQIRKSDLIEADITGITLANARALAKAGIWKPAEWHHTGTKYRQTDFYDCADLAALIKDAGGAVPLMARLNAPAGEIVVVSYYDSGGYTEPDIGLRTGNKVEIGLEVKRATGRWICIGEPGGTGWDVEGVNAPDWPGAAETAAMEVPRWCRE